MALGLILFVCVWGLSDGPEGPRVVELVEFQTGSGRILCDIEAKRCLGGAP